MNWKRAVLGTLIGYVIAVPVAACVALLFIAAIDLSTGMSTGQIARSLSNIIEYMIPATVITAMTAWPGYLITLVVAHWKKIYSPLFFAAGGSLTAVLAVWVLNGTYSFSSFNLANLIKSLASIWFVLPGGLTGGLAYAYWHKWLFHRA